MHFIAGYLVPLVLYFSIIGIRPDRRETDLLLVALAVGTLIPMLHGSIVYLREWGIPGLDDLFWSRYDVERMATYRDVTFGSTGQTSTLLALVVPPLLCRLFDPAPARLVRTVIAGALLVCVFNVLIVHSRAVIVVLLLQAMAIAWFYQRMWFLLSAGAVLGLVTYWLATGFDYEAVATYYGGAALADPAEDASIHARLESIKIGWDMMADHPFAGVGPGLSHLHNPYHIAHQLHVAQGSEVGVFGAFAITGISAVTLGHFVMHLARRSLASSSIGFTWLSGASSWVLAGTIAGAHLNSGLVSAWVGLFVCFVALACADSLPRSPLARVASG